MERIGTPQSMCKGHAAPLWIPLRDYAVLVTLGLYLLFNAGFMQVRFPPVADGGVPLGELVLIVCLASLNLPLLLKRLGGPVLVLPLLVWWGFGLGRAFFAVPQYGMWALRDATHVIESLFLLVGFACAARTVFVDRLFRWLPVFLVVVTIYALGYPVQDLLQSFSPQITAGGGHVVPLFFVYVNTGTLLVWAAAYVVLFRPFQRLRGVATGALSAGLGVIAPLLVAYPVLIFQSRIIYLQVIAVFGSLALLRRKMLGRYLVGAACLVGVILLIPVLGINVTGRLGSEISADFLFHHFLSIGGVESEGVEASAGGVFQRLSWWLDLYERWTSSIVSLVAGLGFGFPLVDFGGGHGGLAREPHNSYVSILSRVGLIGGVAWVWFHLVMLGIWRRAYRICTRNGWHEAGNRLSILMAFIVMSWVYATGEDAFEKPFIAIPYYFFWGVILRYAGVIRGAVVPTVARP